ncbi:uncharacterized protein A4U43_UnF9140 [Asparagus officinalis]|uniref:Uncharacterized protein n=1 Tax=Asparagus officinalis TaxID=4686 RepID=A0A1R3L5T0_ASPOF|nr:uncharacterized protein A4U43_UnF9140 [Asparagus officinalis]
MDPLHQPQPPPSPIPSSHLDLLLQHRRSPLVTVQSPIEVQEHDLGSEDHCHRDRRMEKFAKQVRDELGINVVNPMELRSMIEEAFGDKKLRGRGMWRLRRWQIWFLMG